MYVDLSLDFPPGSEHLARLEILVRRCGALLLQPREPGVIGDTGLQGDGRGDSHNQANPNHGHTTTTAEATVEMAPTEGRQTLQGKEHEKPDK